MSSVGDDASSQYDFGVLERKSRAQHVKINLTFAAFFAQVCAIAALVFVVLWFAMYDVHEVPCDENNGDSKLPLDVSGKISTTDTPEVCYKDPTAFSEFPGFDYHALLMPLGMVIIVGEGAISFRVLRSVSKKTVKVIHMFIMLLSVLVVSPGIYCIFATTSPGMTNIHDWIGLTAIISLILQWLVGFLAKVVPGAPPPLEAWYRPIHNYFGVFIFILNCAVTLIGTTLAAPSDGSAAGILSKAFVFAIIAYAALVVFIIVNTDFKRPDAPDPEHLLLLGGKYFGRRRSYGIPSSPGDGKIGRGAGPRLSYPTPPRESTPVPSTQSASLADEEEEETDIDIPQHVFDSHSPDEEPIVEAYHMPEISQPPPPQPEAKEESPKPKRKPFSEWFAPKSSSPAPDASARKKSDPSLLDWVSR